MNDITQDIKQIILDNIENIKIEDISLDKTLQDIGGDSLDSVEIVIDIESKFNINVNDQDFNEIHTVQDIINYVKTKIA